MKTLLVLLSCFVISNSQAYYYYITSKPKTQERQTPRYAYPVPKTGDSTFGANAASGFTMTYPASYIHILSHCFGLTTNLEKLVLRGLTIQDKNTKRRLNCYVTGLGKSLEEFTYKENTAMEIAEQYNNQAAIDFMLSL